jgi:hypothetical protein
MLTIVNLRGSFEEVTLSVTLWRLLCLATAPSLCPDKTMRLEG